MYEEMSKFILKAVEKYLENAVSSLKNDLRSEGIEPDA